MILPDPALLAAGVAFIFASGFAAGWLAGRAVTRYMLGGRL
jgi:hypothetical protein